MLYSDAPVVTLMSAAVDHCSCVCVLRFTCVGACVCHGAFVDAYRGPKLTLSVFPNLLTLYLLRQGLTKPEVHQLQLAPGFS